MERCFLCDETRTAKCRECKSVHFCHLHRSSHKIGENGSCSFIRSEKFGDAGRGLVATKDYSPGDVVFALKPATLGPCVRSQVQCVNCLMVLHDKMTCSKCSLPVCDTKCERGEHHQAECQVLQKIRDGLKDQQGGRNLYKAEIKNLTSAVMTIRLFSLKWRDPGTWNLVSMLMDHDGNPELWKSILQAYKSILIKDPRFEENELKRVFGIQCTNGANLHLPPTHGRGVGVYPIFALLNHSCMCNSETLESAESHSVVVKARFKIETGEEISTCYLKPEQATFARRQFLFNKWNFWCSCRRCSDPSELGAFSGGMVCLNGRCGGLLLPCSPLEEISPWFCQDCRTQFSWHQISNILEQTLLEVESAGSGGSVERLEELIFTLRQYLYHTHYMLIQVEQRLLLQYWDRSKGNKEKISRPVLDRIIQLSKNILVQQERTDPGESRQRRILEEIYYSSILERGCKDFKLGVITREKLQNFILCKQARMKI
ncbi:protein msta [Eurytemora carolleeae]|uniref:protein msta n=1 Tax=Eurytemora carolleeae TaxID=1294199 RepID=UPI000C77C1CC|nr:protein msta [Eurytemora carolleeae]|eukprot:XP_023325101.1 protein msta-like [Eurytemora affinis]